HVATIYDGNATAGQRIKFYVNGNAAPVTVLKDDGSGPPQDLGHARIGAPFRLDEGGFQGSIDEVELFTGALTEVEIRAIAGAGSAGKCRPCLSPPGG